MPQISSILLVLTLISCASSPPEPVSYLKPPFTGGEVAVAKTLETMITAYNNRDFAGHLSCFAAEARIYSRIAGKLVSKVEYQKILKKNSKTATLQLTDTQFMEISPIKYRVDAVIPGRNSYDVTFELVPSQGRWVILEQRYK